MRRAPSLRGRPVLIVLGLAVLAAAWTTAAAGAGITGHMAAHMATVVIAAPLLALGLAGRSIDPASRWPRFVAPVPMSLLELVVVWGWHLPAARAAAAAGGWGLALEQAAFAAAGLLLWSACFGGREGAAAARRAEGVAALLLTTMHMTLLGVLVALAPRPLFASAGFTCLGVDLAPLADQQLGGVVMLLIGAGGYLAGAMALLAGLLGTRGARPAWR